MNLAVTRLERIWVVGACWKFHEGAFVAFV